MLKNKKKKELVNPFQGLSFGLGSLPLLSNSQTRSLSAENPKGDKGGGAKWAPDPDNPDLPHSRAALDLGKGWKVRPFVRVPKGNTLTLADVKGSGIIQHIWMTCTAPYYRQCILRFYWDDEDEPSIETPLSDFFGMGHDIYAKLSSLVVTVNPSKGLNCYWPMPFKKHCRITFENDGVKDIEVLAYQISYAKTDIPTNIGYLHAQWRRSTTKRSNPEHVILNGVQGQGHYVGTFLAWTQLSDGWWGEGEIKFFIDGDKEYPTICGTGTEDYFGGAWDFGGWKGSPESYSFPFQGYHLCNSKPGEIPKHNLYRWHIMDPIRFQHDIRVKIQALGHWPNKKFKPLEDDIASIAYWYQKEPHNPFPKLLPKEDRWPRNAKYPEE
jgi:hypothetical protein